jgi:hypothetical protein
MPINIAIDDVLLDEELKLSDMRTKRAAVIAVLEEFVRRRQQLAVVDLFGQIDFDETYNYKTQRNRR